MICGNFNSQIGDNIDNIKGVDNIPGMDVIDFESNSYCAMFLDFLITANCCVKR